MQITLNRATRSAKCGNDHSRERVDTGVEVPRLLVGGGRCELLVVVWWRCRPPNDRVEERRTLRQQDAAQSAALGHPALGHPVGGNGRGTPSESAVRNSRPVMSKICEARRLARSKLKPSISSETWMTPPELTR